MNILSPRDVIVRLLGEDFADMVRDDIGAGAGAPAEYTPGELTLGELGLAAVLRRVLAQWQNRIDGGLQSGLRTFGQALMVELDDLSDAVVEPWAGLFWRASQFLEHQLFEMNDAYMVDVAWGEALDTAANHAARYELEKDREAPLTAGEFWYCVAMAAREVRVGLTVYKSTVLPTGLRRHENWGTLAQHVMISAFWAARFLGCWRAPHTYWDEPIPDDYDPPYSIPGY